MSEGEGDRLSSTLNLPEVVQFNRFNPDRYTSTPQVNTTGFIDDNYESSRGTHFEPRVCTRSRGATNTIDMKLTFHSLKGKYLSGGKLSALFFKRVMLLSLDIIFGEY